MNTKQSDFYRLSIEDTLKILDTSKDGLSESEVEKRLRIYGPNEIPEQPKTGNFKRFLLQFHNPLIYVLLGAALVTAFLNLLLDTLIILLVVVINALIGYIQEGKAEKAIDAIRKMLAPSSTVLREGERRKVAAKNLVTGDIVILEAGDKVSADLRLIKTHGLQIQEAVLTGESVPVEKGTGAADSGASLGDRKCMAFSGTVVTNGQGKGVVAATRSETEIGRIVGMISKVEKLTTPLVKQMNVFSKKLTVFILIISFFIFMYGYYFGNYEFVEILMAVVGLAVAAIPEGLPTVLTITLAIGVQKMARQHAIVRRLPAIETLGSVSVICTDKTGTLTLNEMMVASVVTASNSFKVEGSGYSPEGKISSDRENAADPGSHPILSEIGLAASLCNDAVLKQNEGIWEVEGDVMEGALLSFAGKLDVSPSEERKRFNRTDLLPFDSKHAYMATLNHDHEGYAFIIVKGAPEKVLAMCNKQRKGRKEEETLDRTYWEERVESIAQEGQRVLAFAVKEVPPKHTVLEYADVGEHMVLLGVVGLIDPPRPSAKASVEECQRAGIRVKMITGDHVATAKAIGSQVGILNGGKVLTGADLDHLDDGELKEAVVDVDIYARTSPEHKLKIVTALQAHGMTVAMTGDGVNDAPALKRADVGIAMGKKGTEAAKEAAEFVLADDSFISIAHAVREGRTAYDNIKKVISWTLPTSAGEAMTIMIALLFGLTLPITPIQILWVNLVTAVTLGIALAFEPAEDSVMLRPPLPQEKPLLTGDLIWHILLVSFLFFAGVYGVFLYALEKGHSIALARTLAFSVLVVLEVFHLFYIRNIFTVSLTWKKIRGTKMVWMTVGIVFFIQLAAIYFPPLQEIVASESIPLNDGILITFIGVIFFLLIEAEKQVRLRLFHAEQEQVL